MWNKLKEQFNLLKLEKKKLYLVTNSDKFQSKDDFLNAIASALQGGVDIIEFNETSIPDKVIVELGHKIRILCDEYGATLIVNKRADIASIIEADGICLSQDDINITNARNILGENAIIGKICHTPDDIIEAMNDGADYITVGPVYTNPSKIDESIDIDIITWAQENTDLPLFAFGDIDTTNIGKFVNNNINKIVVSDFLMYAQIPEKTARELLRYLP